MKNEKLYRKCTVRLFPTKKQEELMWKHVYCCRFTWNYMLGLQIKRRELNKKHLSWVEMNNEITTLRKQCTEFWLKDVALGSLQQVCNNLDQAYKNFFNKTHGFPKFKTKKHKKHSFPLKPDGTVTYFINNDMVVVPKIGHVLCHHNYNVPIGRGNKISDPQISYIKSSKKWILTFSLERESQTTKLTDKSMGIDLGVKELAVVAFGDEKLVFHNINKSKRMRSLEKKRKHIKRAIDRKYRTYNGFGTPAKGQTWKKSKNIERYEQMLREIEAKISNIRKNYRHHVTKELVELLPRRVVMENLNMASLLNNKHISKAIIEQGLFLFINTMKYKCEEYEIEFIQVDRWYPSSKTCSDCGHIKKDLKLKDRTFVCPVCGLEIDRDYNAAINLMNYTEKISTTANNLVSGKLLA